MTSPTPAGALVHTVPPAPLCCPSMEIDALLTMENLKLWDLDDMALFEVDPVMPSLDLDAARAQCRSLQRSSTMSQDSDSDSNWLTVDEAASEKLFGLQTALSCCAFQSDPYTGAHVALVGTMEPDSGLFADESDVLGLGNALALTTLDAQHQVTASTHRLALADHVRAISWPTADTAFVASGTSVVRVSVLSELWAAGGNRLRADRVYRQDMVVRDCSWRPGQPGVAFGGSEERIKIVDVETGELTYARQAFGPVSSTEWLDAHALLSLTTDEGGFELRDTRLRSGPAVGIEHDEPLFSHCWLDAHEVLLSGGMAGRIQCWDTRNTRQPLWKIIDCGIESAGLLRTRMDDGAQRQIVAFGTGMAIWASPFCDLEDDYEKDAVIHGSLDYQLSGEFIGDQPLVGVVDTKGCFFVINTDTFSLEPGDNLLA